MKLEQIINQYVIKCFSVVFLVTGLSLPAFTQNWVPFEGEKNLAYIFTNTIMYWEGGNGEYYSDGTGMLYAHGTAFPRTWKVIDEHKVGVLSDYGEVHYTLEQNANDLSQFRVLDLMSRESTIVRVVPGEGRRENREGTLFEDWILITDDNEIRALFDGTVYEWDGGQGEYCSNGTGKVYSYNGEYLRQWTVQNGSYCLLIQSKTTCYEVEKHVNNPSLYRERNLETGAYQIFRKSSRSSTICE